MTRTAVIEKLQSSFDDGSFLATLARRVAIKTESQIAASRPHLATYLEGEMAPALAAMGYEVRVLPNPEPDGGPFLVARRIEDPALPTVLTYGHGDVVRGLEPEWRKGLDPWTLTREGERIYGRGVADNKGQHSINIAALSAVIAVRGRLGFNSIVLLEMSEEIGSPGIHAFCEQQRALLKADILVSSDGPRLSAGRPTLFMGSRGAMNLDFSLTLREGGHHSGNWGGLLANPGVILARALGTIVDEHGKVLCRDILPDRIPNSVRAALADVEVDGGEDGPAIDPDWGEPGLTPAERVFAWNTFEILAYRTGNPDNPVNAIPPRATAHCQIRYTVDKHPRTFIPALQKHLQKHGFKGIEVREARGRTSWGATRMLPDEPWVQWAAKSLQATTGQKPALLPNLGGSLPNDAFADVLGMPTVWVPHSYASCSQHAPNEHGLAPVMREGLAIMGGLFWDMGERPEPFLKARAV
ncbi:MAG: M20 family metallopeptidase [Alphaproteobacteria bacterium]|nr:M20 family metallopeptidase [Alphaproteobacteria bacterium]